MSQLRQIVVRTEALSDSRRCDADVAEVPLRLILAAVALGLLVSTLLG